jgi:hypothetical protein
MAEWFYRIGDQSFGPVTNTQLLDLVRLGKVDGDTQIRKDDSNWVLAQSVGGLLEAGNRDESETVCPYCGKSIAPPPTRCESCLRDVTVVMRANEVETIHRQSKTISGVLNPYEDVIPEVEETAQSHFLIVLVATLVLLSIPLVIYLWFNRTSMLVVQMVGGLLGAFVVVGLYSYYLAVKSNNRRDD